MASSTEPQRSKPAPPSRRPTNTPVAYVVIASVVALAGFGIVQSIKRSLGEYWIAFPTMESLKRAVEITPGNSLGWQRLGMSMARRGGDRETAISYLEKAVSLQPYDVQAWIALGFQREVAGDKERAVEALQHAARIDAGFLPRWSLANFYLRQNNLPEFWRWIRATMEIYPRGVESAIGLCRRAFDDPDLILEKCIPDEPRANRDYFAFLVQRREFSPAKDVWGRVERSLQAEDTDLVLAYVDGLLQQGDQDGALAAWNRLCELGLLPYSPLSPERGPVLTNGDLRARPIQRGFDWRFVKGGGVYWEARSAGTPQARLVLNLTGTHSPSTALLVQLLPVRPGENYILGFEYQTQELPKECGIFWLLQDPRNERIVAQSEVLAASGAWRNDSMIFQAPREAGVLALILKYQRVPGTTRSRGVFEIRRLAVSREADAGAALSAEGAR